MIFSSYAPFGSFRTRFFLDVDDGGSPAAGSSPAPAASPAVTPAAVPPVSAPAAPESAVPTVAKRERLSPKVLSPGQIPGTVEEVVQQDRAKRNVPPKGEDGKFVSPKKVATPAAPTAPAPRVGEVAPPAAAAPVVPAAATPAPAAPQKIKVGDKEYTTEELASLVEKANQPAAAPVAPVPAAPEQTDEQKALEHGTRRKEWLDKTVASLDLPELSTDDLNVILDGGPEAAAKFSEIRKRDVAAAILETRMSIEQDINPVLQQFHQMLSQVTAREQSLVEYEVQQTFSTRHAELVPHADLARQVANQLLERYPQETSKLSQEQFVDEIARQTESILNQRAKTFGIDNWRKLSPAQQQAAAPAAAPTQETAPAPVVRKQVAPVPSNLPVSVTPAKGGWAKNAAARVAAR